MSHPSTRIGAQNLYLIPSLGRIVSLFLLGLLQTSCGDLGTDRQSNSVRQSEDERFFARTYFLADPQCNASSLADQKIDQLQVNRWQDGRLQQVDAKLKATNADFSSDIISEAYYGSHTMHRCAIEGGQKKCDGTVDELENGIPLGVCKSAVAYPRRSFEGIGTAAASLIAKGNQFYKSINGHRPSNSKNLLLVLPKIEEQLTEVFSDGQEATHSTYKSDNLAYRRPNEQFGQGIFFIYPMGGGARSQKLFREFNYWEVPFAQVHEVGHHVFFNHAGSFESHVTETFSLQPLWQKLTSGVLSRSALNQSSTWESAKHRSLLRKLGKEARVTSADYWRSTGESFADLFAFYALNDEERRLAGVTCLERSRAVDSELFMDGSKKLLTQQVLDKFEGRNDFRMIDPCFDTDYQDIHTLGAIVAYGINLLWDVTAEGDRDVQATRLLKWADRLPRAVRLTNGIEMANSSRGGLYPWLKEAALVVKGSRSNLSDKECAVLTNVFAAYNSLWTDEFGCNREQSSYSSDFASQTEANNGSEFSEVTELDTTSTQPLADFLTTRQQGVPEGQGRNRFL